MTHPSIRKLGESYCATCGHTGYQHHPGKMYCGECRCNLFVRECPPIRSFLGAVLAWIVGAP